MAAERHVSWEGALMRGKRACGRVARRARYLCTAVALLLMFALAGCNDAGGAAGSAPAQTDVGVASVPVQTDTTVASAAASGDLAVNPQTGTPLACPCGLDCEDEECVEAQRAFGLGLYPWLALELAGSDADAPHRVFLNLPDAQYETIADLMADKPISIGFSSAFLNALYNGPSTLSLQHYYEYLIMEWLAYDCAATNAVEIPGQIISGANAAFSLANETQNLEMSFDKEYDKLIKQWEGLTGEKLADSPLESTGIAGKFSGAVSAVADGFDKLTYAQDVAEDLRERWADINAVCSASFDKIALLETAADQSDNQEFADAAHRVVDAYHRAVDEDGTIDWSLDSLASSQLDALVVDQLWNLSCQLLGKDNPFISTALDVLDLAFNNADAADANMTLLGVTIVGAELRQGLTHAMSEFTADLSDLYDGVAVDSPATYVRCFKAYLDFQMYAIDESSDWARAVSSHPFAEKEAAAEIIDYAVTEKRQRADIAVSVQELEEEFWDIEDHALFGACTCEACAQQQASEEQQPASSEQQDAPSQPRDVSLVLDVSGSMEGDSISRMKEAAQGFIDVALEGEASIGIVSYNDEATVLQPLSSSGRQLSDAVAQLSASGNTNIDGGLQAAEGVLGSAGERKRIVVLMSDGAPNTGRTGDELITYADGLKEQGYKLYTVGFNEGTEGYALLSAMASDGCHYEVQSAEDLEGFFTDIASEINGTRFMYVRAACPVDIEVTFDGETLSSAAEAGTVRTSFGSLSFEDELDADGNVIEENGIKILRLREGPAYDVDITGTGTGEMDYSIGFVDEAGDYTDFRTFEAIDVGPSTKIATTAAVSDRTRLTVDSDGDGVVDVAYEAGAGERAQRVENRVAVYATFGACTALTLAIGYGAVRRARRKARRAKETTIRNR